MSTVRTHRKSATRTQSTYGRSIRRGYGRNLTWSNSARRSARGDDEVAEHRGVGALEAVAIDRERDVAGIGERPGGAAVVDRVAELVEHAARGDVVGHD